MIAMTEMQDGRNPAMLSPPPATPATPGISKYANTSDIQEKYTKPVEKTRINDFFGAPNDSIDLL
jgi:hypothetical protein